MHERQGGWRLESVELYQERSSSREDGVRKQSGVKDILDLGRTLNEPDKTRVEGRRETNCIRSRSATLN